MPGRRNPAVWTVSDVQRLRGLEAENAKAVAALSRGEDQQLGSGFRCLHILMRHESQPMNRKRGH